MCMTCGCMMIDKKTSPDAITLDDLFRIADSHGLEPEEVLYNLQITTDAYLNKIMEKKMEHAKLEIINKIPKKKKSTTNLQNSQK